MQTRRVFTSLILLVIGMMALTACAWTEFLEGPEIDPIPTIAIPTPQIVATPRTQTIGGSEDLTGEWVGQAFVDDGTELYYALELNQDGTEITGLAYSSDETGAASVSVSGTYEDGLLQLEEYSADLLGDWDAVCYWKIELRVSRRSSRVRLVGTFDDIPSSENDCIYSGEITLSRP